jgi:predicted acyl esterase
VGESTTMRPRRPAIAALLAFALLLPAAASADPAPSAGLAWEPAPASQPLYGTKAPSADPAVQQAFVKGDDGVDLFVETWLPAAKDGDVPPEKIPTILIMTPYVVEGRHRYTATRLPNIIEYFTARGYAVAQHHVRGTGESGGCLEQTAANQIADGANVVQYLGRDAAWSNGSVGMYGRSYDGETQIATAGAGDPEKIRYLKAIIPIATVGSQYDWNFMDGVPWFLQPAAGNASYLLTSAAPGQRLAPVHLAEKLTCQPEVMASSANQTGDYTTYWRDREYRPGASKVTAATLMVHGLRDFNVQAITLAGWFDRLPATTPKKGLFGVWEHATPGSHTVGRDWERADFLDMATAWYDRYLKGLDTGVEDWPEVQLQSSDGQWWVAPDFPTTGGPMGQLALGPDGTLGATAPAGASSYTEQRVTGTPRAGESLVFQTPVMTEPLHLTGQPMLDLWVSSNLPDGHVAAKLEIIGPNGQPATAPGNGAQATYGVRSLMHIDPMQSGWFEQELGKPFPISAPTKVVVRLLPTDLVVPVGSRLRLTLSGSVSYAKGSSLPSGAGSQITIHHDCTRPSVLRFRMPDPDAQLLNVREKDEIGQPLTSTPAEMGVRDGAGLASAAVCDAAPVALPFQ